MSISLDQYVTSLRPRTFREFLGHERWFEGLTRQISGNDERSSYQPIALAGERGVGKRTLAELYAQALVCEKAIDIRIDCAPCGVCDECQAFRTASFAYVEIDVRSLSGGASVSAGDEANERRKIRTLIDRDGGLNTAPVRVVVFENAEEFSPSAADVALKTLEDDLSTTAYVFLVNDVERFSAALRSRCSMFRVGPIQVEKLVERMTSVCRGRSVVFDEFSIRAIGVASEGSYGSALEILKRVELHGDVTLANLLREPEFDWGAPMLECWRAVLGGRRDEAVMLFGSLGNDGPTRLKAIQAFLVECRLRHELGGLPSGVCVSPALDCLPAEGWDEILGEWDEWCALQSVALGDVIGLLLSFWAGVGADVPWRASFMKGYDLLGS